MAWALATLPLIWLLGRRVGGAARGGDRGRCSPSPPSSLYYSVEARMYAMLWFFAALTAWLTLRLHDRGGLMTAALWILASAGGLLTHYFYVFVWAASVAWLPLRPGRCPRPLLAGALSSRWRSSRRGIGSCRPVWPSGESPAIGSTDARLRAVC